MEILEFRHCSNYMSEFGPVLVLFGMKMPLLVRFMFVLVVSLLNDRQEVLKVVVRLESPRTPQRSFLVLPLHT